MLPCSHGTIIILCVVTAVGAWYPPAGRWNPTWRTLGNVGLLLSLPEITGQWSFLNLWPSRTFNRPETGLNEVQEEQDVAARVLNFFPVPVEEECLSADKRRQGICMNTYECRIQHGVSHGPCALGFGVCCIFTASCDNEVQNNLTYVTSPGFPNLIDRPMNCTVVVRKIDTEVSQLRIDFVHFHIGQPNAMTGVCDQDAMAINNSRTTFELCGWNSGQHVYVDVSDSNEPVTLNFRLPAVLQSRIWEMRVVQLGFEQRAPTGCLQYFRSPNGTLRTFNYLPNGRYLAGHDYLLCVRQERDMCGISYQPCTPDSFRIGPEMSNATNNAIFLMTTSANVDMNSASVSAISPDPAASTPPSSDAVEEQAVEGSGARSPELEMTFDLQEMASNTSLASALLGRCRDRVLIPCDFEEFITPGNNMAGICNLEHCGRSLCNQYELDAEGNCRVETWSTPFRIRVAFGSGSYTGGTLEDNAGMCLMYQQLPCVA